MTFPTLFPSFFTATCKDWLPILQENASKEIIINSLKYLVENNRVRVFGFVIMSNHIHIIWEMLGAHKPADVQRDFMKYTGQYLKYYLERNNAELLKQCLVNAKDRKYQIWKRNPLSIDIYTKEVMLQKLNYIHQNPVRAGLCLTPETYYYSSAAFNVLQDEKFGFLSHYHG
jgi:REP element-mobilizing transposase RayT